MKEKRPVSLFVVVMNCLCAVLWTVNCVKGLLNGNVRGLDVACAIVWCICAAVWIKRYLDQKKSEE